MPFPTMANLIFNPQQVFTIFLLLLLLPHANSITFNFSSFPANAQNLTFEGDAFSNGELQVTKNQRNVNLGGSVGRASYSEPVRLWDANTDRLTDFTTHFSFRIEQTNNDSFSGDGLSFFLAPFDSTLPPNSGGGYLGLFSNDTALNTSKNQIVAVEFDTFPNGWDPNPNHVGINVNSIASVANVSWNSSFRDGKKANAWITYNSTTHNLSVFLTYANNPVFGGNSSLSYVVDLRMVLPEKIRVGFSAATGISFELHTVLSWAFSSTLEVTEMKNNITQDMPMMQTNKNITTEDMPMTMKKNKNSSGGGLVVGLVVPICVLSTLLGLFCFIRRRRRRRMNTAGEDLAEDESMDDEFEKGTGPKRFTFSELSRSTNNFSEEGKLGEGGFGGVYKGLLSGSNIEVAVKRISSGSKQGKKEYVSEVRIISRLRQKNLVQLIGWCHEKGEFLLVYEYMPNGSLDAHLFGKKVLLAWTVRYKISLGLASALLYLHEEWEQCVVHRDIKSSNIMLDSQFNAKLGDFGLARLVDHELGSQTTVLAGTMGYLAPECLTTGKSSKESDVYSFGVVALEITCGRKPVDPREEPSKVRLVEWVWDLYGKGQLLEAADKGLNMEFEEAQIECLMIVGLWCCHPDFTLRPSIRQVINVLNFEAPLPSLPSKQPVPTYYAPPMDICRLSYTTSSGFPDSEKYGITQGSSSTTNSSLSISSTVALLYSPKSDV